MPPEDTSAAGAPAAAAPAAAPAASAAAPAGSAPAPAAAAPIAAPAGGAPAGDQAGNEGKTPEQIALEAEAAAKAAGAPEKYEAFTQPEGTMLDQGVIDQFTEAARELNLPQAAAQKLVDKMAPVMAQRQAEQAQQLVAEWETACTTDKEFGGAQLEQSKALAAKAMDQFATPEFKEMLNQSGMGNHPELMRMMVKVGRAISEEKIVIGGVPATSIRTPAQVLYPASSLKS